MRESDIEQKLVRRIKMLGGKAYKWISPGNAGVPDRIVILPDGRVIFVELKTEKGHLSPVQKSQIKRLQNSGCDVRVLYGIDDVEGFINDL